MLKLSDLQSQVALNRNYLKTLEEALASYKFVYSNLRPSALHYTERKSSNLLEMKYYKKLIKQYAKLQRALKSEIAYRIAYNRELRYANMNDYQMK